MTSNLEITTFFIDRCLGKHPISEILKETGVKVEIHDDHFPQNALDTEWIPEVGKRGWIILTKDARIGRNPLERQAIARAQLRMFTLTSRQLSGKDTAITFKKAVPKMLKFVQQYSAPFIAKVYKNGRVQPWKNASDLLNEI